VLAYQPGILKVSKVSSKKEKEASATATTPPLSGKLN
jgi:hypothetical protein